MSEITNENYLRELFIDEAKAVITAKSGYDLYDLGTVTSFNVNTLIENGTLPDTIDPAALTVDNFIVSIDGGIDSWDPGDIGGLVYGELYKLKFGSLKPTKRYIADTGLFTVGPLTQSITMSNKATGAQIFTISQAISVKVYLVC